MAKMKLTTTIICTIFLLFCFAFSTVKSREIRKVKIICEKTEIANWTVVEDLLICLTNNDTKVLKPNSVADNGIKNESIEGIEFRPESKVRYMPKGLKDNYPNLKAIYFHNQPLKTLTEDDMEQFGSDLEYFVVYYGEITFLEKHLFRHNPNLKYIRFLGNPLKFIEPGFFEHISSMEKLERIDLRSSLSCINDQKAKPDIQHATWNNSCNDQTAMTMVIENNNLLKNLEEAEEQNKKLARDLKGVTKTNEELSANYKAAVKMYQKFAFTPEKVLNSIVKHKTDINCSYWSINFESVCKFHIGDENADIDRVNYSDSTDELPGLATKTLRIENDLMHIPSNLGSKFPKLTKLIIESTGLVEICKEKLKLELNNLKILNLTKNILIQIPSDAFDNLMKLEILDLSFNYILSFNSSAVEKLKHLKFLHLRGNKLNAISASLIEFLPQSIEIIDLKDNDCINLEFPSNIKTQIAEEILEKCNLPLKSVHRNETKINNSLVFIIFFISSILILVF